MGNYRFRLSDMIPNAWFYKLKDMGRARHHNISKRKQQPTSTAAATQPSKLKQPLHSCPRESYYFTRELVPSDDRFLYDSPTNTHFPDPPSKSSKQRSRKRATRSNSPKHVTTSVSAGCSCGATLWTKPDTIPPEHSASSSSDSSLEAENGDSFPPEFRTDRILATEAFDDMISWSRSCRCGVNSNAKDIIIDVDKKSFAEKLDKLDELNKFSEVDLPPIITKPAKFNDAVKEISKKEQSEPTRYRRSSAKFEEKNAHGSLSLKVVKEERITTTKQQKNTSPVRKISVNSPGMRLRINSPRIASRRFQGHARKSVSTSSSLSSRSRRSLSDSLAVVKSSFDPQRDFRDSMVEMIVENNIRASKDLEDLLACYLSLNADEYHDLIIKVFKQIWFDLTDVRLK